MFVEGVSVVGEDLDGVAVQEGTEEDRDVVPGQVHIRGAFQSALILPAGIEPVPIPNIRVLQEQPIFQDVETSLYPYIVRRHQCGRAHQRRPGLDRFPVQGTDMRAGAVTLPTPGPGA